MKTLLKFLLKRLVKKTDNELDDLVYDLIISILDKNRSKTVLILKQLLDNWEQKQ